MLFQVVRGGIEFVWISWLSHGPSAPRILSLVLAFRAYVDDKLFEVVSPAISLETAMSPNSVSSDQTILLSSKSLMRSRRSSAPTSVAPFLCAYRDHAILAGTGDKALVDCLPSQRR